MLNVGATTLKNWSKMYAPFLSDTATPKDSGHHRAYSLDDIRVFTKVIELTKQGMSHDSAYVTIANGARGELPPAYADYSLVIESKDQLVLLQAHVRDLEAQVEMLKGEHDRAEKLEGQVRLLTAQLDTKEKELRETLKELWKLQGD